MLDRAGAKALDSDRGDQPPSGLGAVRGTYGRSRKALVKSVVGSLVLVLGGVAIGTALWLDPPPGRAEVAGLASFAGMGVVVGMALLVAGLRRRDLRVTLYDGGFSYTLRGRTRVFPWAEIERVWRHTVAAYASGIPAGTFHTIRVEARSGDRVKLDHWTDRIAAVDAYVAQESSRRIQPRVLERLRNGERVPFGARLAIDADAVWLGRKRLARRDLTSADVANGFIRLYSVGKRHPSAQIRFATVPNAAVFLGLIAPPST